MLECRAEIAASVFQVLVTPGQPVAAEDELIILESMKMEIPVVCPANGVVAEVKVEPGDQVAEGDLLVVIDPS